MATNSMKLKRYKETKTLHRINGTCRIDFSRPHSQQSQVNIFSSPAPHTHTTIKNQYMFLPTSPNNEKSICSHPPPPQPETIKIWSPPAPPTIKIPDLFRPHLPYIIQLPLRVFDVVIGAFRTHFSQPPTSPNNHKSLLSHYSQTPQYKNQYFQISHSPFLPLSKFSLSPENFKMITFL